jgi:glycerophosphoryl diester phosphodiesterase
MKIKKATALSVFCLVAFVYFNNSSLFAEKSTRRPILLAHRGLGQTFDANGIDGKTNTARRIFKPEHPYLENTIVSMEAAFNCGADIVELDIHSTTDGQFAVFHDELLDYRTNGTGLTEEHSMQELKLLDVGYGYTADSGKTFPFRGKGVGLMPTLTEVLEHFPHGEFLIHVKSDEAREGDKLAAYLKTLPQQKIKQLSVFGGDKPISRLKELMPGIRVTSRKIMERSLILYTLIGWTGYVPKALRNTQIHLPDKYARFVWGWPYRFLNRMEKVNTRIFLVKGNGKFSEGFDDSSDIKLLPANYSGGVWTNRIDRIAPLLKTQGH